jgi:hypothetical protein
VKSDRRLTPSYHNMSVGIAEYPVVREQRIKLAELVPVLTA